MKFPIIVLVAFIAKVSSLTISGPIYDDSENSIYPPPAITPPKKYDPTWESLDSRPLPSWFDNSKVGVFIHWGVFSVPSYQEWFWYRWIHDKNPAVVSFMKNNYPPKFTYQDFAREFTAEFYDPYRWVDIFKKAGIKYVVLTSKHHEGYTMWPSKYSFGWNSMDVGPKRDLLGDLATAVRNSSDIHFGVYHSLYEWYNPLYLQDKNNSYKTQDFVKQKALPELVELVKLYKPDVIWSDGDWEADDVYWKSKEFLAWLYNSSPVKDTVVTNDRWGKGTSCKHGGFYSCQDGFNPGKLVAHKWENARTLDKNSWAFRRVAGADDYVSPQELISQLVSTVSCGGNLLINVGPTKDGMISAIMEERLLQMGEWLGINGEAIYGSVPWKEAQNDTANKDIWYTTQGKGKQIYAIALEKSWPTEEDSDGKLKLNLGSVDTNRIPLQAVDLLGYKNGQKDLVWVPCNGKNCKQGILITLPSPRLITSKWAWTFVLHLDF